MTSRTRPVQHGARLSEQVAQRLSRHIGSRSVAVGQKLPSEAQLAERYGVSRTVVREAMSRLKSQGLVRSRQGSGVFVAAQRAFAPLDFDPQLADSKAALVQMLELRRALEAEAAALAAERCTPAGLRRLRGAAQALERAVQAGGDGVEEDLAFHRCVGELAANPFLLGALDYLAQFMRGVMRVTRANESRRADFTEQVRQEHAAVVAAIAQRVPASARLGAERHMVNAVVRLGAAGDAFWIEEGARLARPLVRRLAPRKA